MNKHTPGPWRWQGEDYRGGWGWQLLVGQRGEGVLCGEQAGGPYKHLQAHMPIDPKYCRTGMSADDESAPGVHVREADARLIAAAPDLLEIVRLLTLATDEGDDKAQGTHYIDKAGVIRCKGSFLELIENARAAIAKATGEA